jgi:hypothetical protein
MAQIITDGVVERPPRRSVRYSNRNSLIVIVILLLIVAWIYATRGFGSLGFGVIREPAAVNWPAAGVSPTVIPTISAEIGTENVPLTPTFTPSPADVRITDQPGPVPLPGTAPRTAAPIAADARFIGTARVTGDNVNMRSGPRENYRAVVILPRNWEVYVMRQSHVDNAGEVWIEVTVNTDQGTQKGWINRRYLSSTGY